MNKEEIKAVHRLTIMLDKLAESIKANELENFGLEWFTEGRKKRINILLNDFQKLKEMGVTNKVIEALLPFLFELKSAMDNNSAVEVARIRKKYNVSDKAEKINQYLEQVVMQLNLLVSREEYLIEILNNERRKWIIKEYGSTENFLKGLKITQINVPHHPEFTDFYDLYVNIFTLPEEQDTPKGFDIAFGLSKDSELLQKFGLFEEVIIMVREPKTNEVVGASVFTLYKMPQNIVQKYGVDGTSHIVYIFTQSRLRRMGVGKMLLGLTEEYVSKSIGSDRILYFCEQNAPRFMSIMQYISDNKNAMIDQCDRLKWWEHRGFRQLGFRYIQPPLEEGGEPCTNLTLNVLAPDWSEVPSEIILEHLNRFFEISVLKKGDISKDKHYMQQREYLLAHSMIPLVTEDLGSLKESIKKIVNSVHLHSELKELSLEEVFKRVV